MTTRKKKSKQETENFSKKKGAVRPMPPTDKGVNED